MTDTTESGETRSIKLGPVEKVIVGILIAVLTSGMGAAVSMAWSINAALARIDGSISLLGLKVDGQSIQISDHESRIRQLERRGP